MDNVSVCIRNTHEYNWVVCRLSNEVVFNSIRMFGFMGDKMAQEDLEENKEDTTNRFIAFARRHKIRSISIGLNGPFKLASILDINKIKNAGITIVRAVDFTPKDEQNMVLQRALARSIEDTPRIEKNMALQRALARARK